jgi:hypothetical protein
MHGAHLFHAVVGTNGSTFYPKFRQLLATWLYVAEDVRYETPGKEEILSHA